MPNIIAHYICGKQIAKKLNIKDNEYLRGNIYPDYVDKNKHYRINGRMFDIPDIDAFMQQEQIENQLFKLGFLTHLMLDKLFLDVYVVDIIYSKIDKNINIFVPGKIYTDYTNISKRLLAHYHLDINEIDMLMQEKTNDYDVLKYKSNISVIKKCKTEELQYLNINSFINFLDCSSEKIANYILRSKYLK